MSLDEYPYLSDCVNCDRGKVSLTMKISVQDLLTQIANDKNSLSNICDNVLMMWTEDQVADALKYAAECVAVVDAMGDSGE